MNIEARSSGRALSMVLTLMLAACSDDGEPAGPNQGLVSNVGAPGIDQPQQVAEPGTDAPALLEPRKEIPLAFEEPNKCSECHADHVNEWEQSNHAYSFVDPVFKAMVAAGQKESGGKLGQFCVQCHTPPGLALEQTPVVMDLEKGHFVQDFSNLSEVAKRGVSCDVCHSITEVIEPVNARMVMTPDGVKRAGIENPLATPAHASEHSPRHETAELCGSCHQVLGRGGILAEETFSEFEKSSAAQQGKTCQSCHMPSYRGPAVKDGPERDLHRHSFVGVDVSLLAPSEFPGYDEQRERASELLRGSLQVTAQVDATAVAVDLQNLAGHAVPSGSTADRQLWIELIARDPTGAVVFESGTLDAQGDLRDGVPGHSLAPGSDPQLVYFGQQLVLIAGTTGLDTDALLARRAEATAACLPMAQGAVAEGKGITPVDFLWQANWQCNYLIQPDTTAKARYELGHLPAGGYDVSVRVLYRTFPPHLLRALEKDASLDPAVKSRLPIVEIAKQNLRVTVENPSDADIGDAGLAQ